MKKIDLLKLRKTAGISQKELADKLAVQPSFLSAIENGRSRFPDEKIEKLKEIIGIDDFDNFMTEDSHDVAVVPPHSHAPEETDSLSQLLRHIHNLAHQNDSADRHKEKELYDRIEYLSVRNDKLSDRIDSLREKIDTLLEENLRLKEILIRHNITY